MSSYSIDGFISITEIPEERPAEGGAAGGLILIIAILNRIFRTSASMIANYFWIPVFGWFFMDSAAAFWISAAVLGILVLIVFVNSDNFVLVLIISILLIGAFLIVPRVIGLKPILSRTAASDSFSEGLDIYMTNEFIETEDGMGIPQGTEFFCEKIDEKEYTITFKGIAVLNGSFVPVEMRFEKSHYPLVKMEVTKKNAQNYYSIEVLKGLINDIYIKHSDNFIEDLLDNDAYPKTHASSDFFKEDLTKNGGVILKGKWFDNSFDENKSSFFYFESKEEYKAFKRIYKKHVSSFNKECYETTSAIGKYLSSYGMGTRE